jgi:hypothetical protein
VTTASDRDSIPGEGRQPHELPQIVGFGRRVGVEKYQHVVVRHLDAAVSGGSHPEPQVGLTHQTHVIGYGRRLGRAIVGDDDLDQFRRVVLAFERQQCAGKLTGLGVVGDDHRHRRKVARPDAVEYVPSVVREGPSAVSPHRLVCRLVHASSLHQSR